MGMSAVKIRACLLVYLSCTLYIVGKKHQVITNMASVFVATLKILNAKCYSKLDVIFVSYDSESDKK